MPSPDARPGGPTPSPVEWSWPPHRPARPGDHARATATGAPTGWRAPTAPPGPRSTLRELRFLTQPLRLVARSPALRTAPRGDGGVVLTMPGYQAPELSLAPLTWWLRRLGHDARTWGLGRNTGDPEGFRDLLRPTVRRLAATSGRPVALVGWSLGGVVARELARDLPDAVRSVVTMGTPVVGGPTYTSAGDWYDLDEQRRILETTDELDDTRPIRVPVTAVVSRRDTVVHWHAQVDVRSTDVRHVEVDSTHGGIGIDPDAWLAAAAALADG